MSKLLVDRIPFAKILAGSAIAFGIALGLCGLSVVLPHGSSSVEEFPVSALGFISLIGMVLSAAGTVITVVLWIAFGVVSEFGRKDTDPQKLFDDSDGDKK